MNLYYHIFTVCQWVKIPVIYLHITEVASLYKGAFHCVV